jgi:hypothetical protein
MWTLSVSLSQRRHFFGFVTTGLDPVVHAEVPSNEHTVKLSERIFGMDCRVKPGNDK